MKRFQRSATLASILLALNGLAFAQASSSSVQGTVTDQSGSVLPGATVVIANNESKITRTATTGEAADYRFLSLVSGRYTLSVTASEFARYEETALQLLVDTPATTNVQLRVGGPNETVTVTSETPVLNLVDASLGKFLRSDSGSTGPTGGPERPDLFSLQAGVS